jgi:uncharacterized membrane protein YbhN (UPF0104 family)
MSFRTLIVRVVGFAITICAFAFVGSSVFAHFSQLHAAFSVRAFLVTIFIGAAIYALALQLVALAWYLLIRSVDGVSIAPLRALAIFARTQIYKYLPTNVLHMVGRFVIAGRAGASKSALAYAQAGELALLAFTAATMAGIFALPFIVQESSAHGVSPHSVFAAYLLVGIGGLIAAPILARRFGAGLPVGHTFMGLVAAFACYVLFFVVNGLLIVALTASLIGQVGDWWTLIGIAAAGWLLGFVVPGAPGGLGVREAVVIAGLTAAGIPLSSATAIALGHRLITLGGDSLLALVELVLSGRLRRSW